MLPMCGSGLLGRAGKPTCGDARTQQHQYVSSCRLWFSIHCLIAVGRVVCKGLILDESSRTWSCSRLASRYFRCISVKKGVMLICNDTKMIMRTWHWLLATFLVRFFLLILFYVAFPNWALEPVQIPFGIWPKSRRFVLQWVLGAIC